MASGSSRPRRAVAAGPRRTHRPAGPGAGRPHGRLPVRLPARFGDRHGRGRRGAALDLTDFDEAHPGGWEWDLRRLVASTWVLGRQNGASENDCEEAATACVAAYRQQVRELYDLPLFERSFLRLGMDELTDAGDVVFLQRKQARRSVIARFVHGDSAWHDHQGMRVVEYQQALQTVSDPLLGWASTGDRRYYVRQFRNMKGTIPLDSIEAAALSDYADQTERDHQRLVDAVERGDLPAEHGL